MRYAKISHVALASESIYLLVKVHAQSPNIRVQLKANQPSNFLSRSCRITTLPKLAGSFPKHPQLPPSLVRVVRKRAGKQKGPPRPCGMRASAPAPVSTHSLHRALHFLRHRCRKMFSNGMTKRRIFLN